MKRIVLVSACLLALVAVSPVMAEDVAAPEGTPAAPAAEAKTPAADPNVAVAAADAAVASKAPVSEPTPTKIVPRKVEVDSNFDGKVDRTEIYDANGQVSRIEIDSNGDGKVDEWMTYENGKPVQSQRDSNGDGKIDVWVEY